MQNIYKHPKICNSLEKYEYQIWYLYSNCVFKNSYVENFCIKNHKLLAIFFKLFLFVNAKKSLLSNTFEDKILEIFHE